MHNRRLYMTRNYCGLLEFLAFECNVLYVGKECKEHFLKISNYFASKTIINLNEKTCEVVDDLVTQNNINLVILDVGTDEFLAVKVYEEIKKIDVKCNIGTSNRKRHGCSSSKRW